MIAISVKNKEYQHGLGGGAGRLLAILPSHEVWARLLALLIAVLLAVTLAQLTWWLVPSAQQSAVPRQDSSILIRTAPAFSQLAESHLFGTPLAQSAGAINAPETTLNLTLRGLFALDGSRALAIIASGAGSEQPYRVGDGLPGGAVVHEIDVDRVILERSGRFETLTLPKVSLASDDAGPQATAITPAGASNLPSRLGEIRRRLRANPAELMGMNALHPVMENGRLKGYQLADNPYMAIMREAGLQPGDVVTSVNGIAVTDTARSAEVIRQLSGASHVELQVLRGGSTRSMSIDLRN